MKKYEAPKIDVIELEVTDIIQTSAGNGEGGGLNANGNVQIPSTGVVVPIPGK